MKTAQQWAQNWVNGMTNAGERIKAGVMNVQTPPGESAVQAHTKMRANWLAAIDGNKWSNALLAVTLDSWKQSMIQKGIPRIADGVRASQGKVQNYATRAIPIMQALQQQVRSMPKITPQDSEARVLAWMRGMRNAKLNLFGLQ